MLFEATHTHPANMCPMLNLEGKAMVKLLFSEENVKKSGIKIVGAYMICPKNTAADHKGFLAIEGENPDAITKFFGPITVEVIPVQPLASSQRHYSAC